MNSFANNTMMNVGLAAIGLSMCAGMAQANVITDWSGATLTSIKATNTAPPPATRTMAMVHSAMFNAVNNGAGQIAGGPTVDCAYDKELAAAKAARDVLVRTYPQRAGEFDAKLTEQINRTPANLRQASLDFGAASAQHVVNVRAGDDLTVRQPYTQGTDLGDYRFTRPDGTQTAPVFNSFKNLQPWLMSSGSQFRPDAPPAIGSQQYAQEYNQVKSLGGKNSATRTAYQSETAVFWSAGSNTVTPPGMWNQIAQTLAAERNLDVATTARLFAALNVGMADAAIAAWDAKATYDLWRPITGIRMGGVDGNPLTAGDLCWDSYLLTPEHQSYVSGHSTFSATAATILAEVLGDGIVFSVTSDETGTTRTFDSFWAAAEEAGMSRIYGGIHWMSDNTAGLGMGREIGLLAAANVVPTPGAVAVGLLGGAVIARRRRRTV
jgi:hypothetical protein